MSNKLLWHGHANFQINTPNISILIDPWFEGNPSAKISAQEITKPDLVLVTHDHDDHTGQAVEICRQTGAHVLAVVETAQKLCQQGVPENQIINGIGANIGGTIGFKDIKVSMLQAHHSSLSGTPVGYIITLENGYCLYHAGDTGIFSSMELYGQLHDIDLAILPTGGVFTMDSKQAALACKLLQCKAVVPMHWGSFPVLEQDTEILEKELKRVSPETKLYALQPGEVKELPEKAD